MAVFYMTLLFGFATDDYDQLISDLAKDEQTARAAYTKLTAAGKKAFPDLLARMDDKTTANPKVAYQEERMILTPKGPKHIPTSTGRFCFLIVRQQLKRDWPGGKADLQFITPENVKAWYKENEASTLLQMQRTVLRNTLELVCKEVAKNGLTNWDVHQIENLSSRLAELRQMEDADR